MRLPYSPTCSQRMQVVLASCGATLRQEVWRWHDSLPPTPLASEFWQLHMVDFELRCNLLGSTS